MSHVQQVLQSDPHYKQQRRRELQPHLDVFAKQLTHIYSIMPFPGFKIDLLTGEMEQMIDPKWQALIDKIKSQQQNFLQEQFPEFYSQQTENQ